MRSRSEIVVMITLGREKLMLGVHEATEQCVVVVLDKLSCRWPVSRVDTGPDSTTDDSFDAMSIICRREAPPGTGRVWRERRICIQLAMPSRSCRGGAAC